MRATDENGSFVNPSVSIYDGANVIICPQAQEHVPESQNVRSLRAVLNTLDDGFVEAVDNSTLLAIASSQPDQSHGLIRGEAIQVPILELRAKLAWAGSAGRTSTGACSPLPRIPT